jgi:membrane protein DedA with SNARE-associated domain
MLSNVLSFFTVVLFSMFKFFAGPLTGLALKLPLLATICATILGMMVSVLFVSFSGPFMKEKVINRFWPTKVLFSKKNRKIVSIWKKYGLVGVAFLTPILLSPIIGTMIAARFGENPPRIILYMFVSALLWGIGLSVILYQIQQVVA